MAGWPFGWRNETEEAAHEAVSERIRKEEEEEEEEPKSRREEKEEEEEEKELKSDGGVGRGNY